MRVHAISVVTLCPNYNLPWVEIYRRPCGDHSTIHHPGFSLSKCPPCIIAVRNVVVTPAHLDQVAGVTRFRDRVYQLARRGVTEEASEGETLTIVQKTMKKVQKIVGRKQG